MGVSWWPCPHPQILPVVCVSCPHFVCLHGFHVSQRSGASYCHPKTNMRMSKHIGGSLSPGHVEHKVYHLKLAKIFCILEYIFQGVHVTCIYFIIKLWFYLVRERHFSGGNKTNDCRENWSMIQDEQKIRVAYLLFLLLLPSPVSVLVQLMKLFGIKLRELGYKYPEKTAIKWNTATIFWLDKK